MARSFSKKDATRLKSEHNKLLNKLYKVLDEPKRYADDMKGAADGLVAQEVLNILRDIPVEELNRDRGGLRIKNLRDAGYNNIADVSTTNVHALASINGISQDAAYTIKRIAQDFTNKARKDTKIRLSIDSKTAQNTELVSSIFRYKAFTSLADKADDLLHEYES